MYYLFGFTHDDKIYLLTESNNLKIIQYNVKNGIFHIGTDPMKDFKKLLIVTDEVSDS